MRLLTFVLIVAVLAAIAFASFVYAGVYDVAATSQEPRWCVELLGLIEDRAIDQRVSGTAPPTLNDPQTIRLGLRHYNEVCVTCHGAPGTPASAIARGLNPAPPELTEVAEVQSPERLFWVLKHGIKMSGMPGFGPTLTDPQIWSMVAFLERLPSLDPDSYEEMLEAAGVHPPRPAAPEGENAEPLGGGGERPSGLTMVITASH